MQNVLETTGLKRAIFLILLGLSVVAALPPVYIWPLAVVGISGLFLFLDKAKTKKQAFLVGWLFGVGFFGGGLYWLTNAFFVHEDKHGWLVPIAVPALAAAMGIFIGLTALLAYVLWRKGRSDASVYGRIFLFAVAWVILEWVRGWIFTGFPWNLIGTVWGFSDTLMQPAAYLGAYGLSLVTILGLTLGAGVFYVSAQQRIVAGLAVLLLPGLFFAMGTYRLSDAQTDVHEGVLLRLVQPNIAQKDKWDRNLKVGNFQKHLDLSIAPSADGKRPTHVIWPETAVTFALNREPNVLKAVASVAPTGGVVITGTPRMTPRGEKPFQVWNSLMAVNELADIVATFDKAHLVPFGEYIPFRDYIPLQKITAGGVDFSAGPGLETISITGLPTFSALICYEVIFPNQVLNEKNRADWLLNLTNDGWYGNTPGPYQHLISARMRSIEEGMPLVRVANTGVSVATDAYGRVQKSLGYGIGGFIDVELSKPLSEIPPAARLKSVLWGSLLVAFFIIGQLLLSRR